MFNLSMYLFAGLIEVKIKSTDDWRTEIVADLRNVVDMFGFGIFVYRLFLSQFY